MQSQYKDELLFSTFYTLFKRKWLLIVAFVVLFITSLFAVFLMTPRFDGTAQLMVDLNPRYQVVLFPDFAQPSERQTNVDPSQNLVEILTNRAMAEAVVERFELGPLLKERKLESEDTRDSVKRSLAGTINWFRSILEGIGLAGPPDEKDDAWWQEQAVTEFIDEWNRIEIEQDTSMINVTIMATSPGLAKEIADWMIQRVREIQRDIVRERFRNMIDYSRSQVQQASRKLEEAAEKLDGFMERENIVSIVKERDLLLTRKSDLGTELINARAVQQGDRVRLTEVRGQLALQDVRTVTSTVIGQNPMVNDFKKELTDLETELAALSLEFTDAHPDIAELKLKVDSVREMMRAEVQEILLSRTEGLNPVYTDVLVQVADAEAALAVADARVTALEAQQESVAVNLKELGPRESRLKELQRDMEAAEKYYLTLKERVLEAEALTDSPGGEYFLKVIDPPYNPDADEASTPQWEIALPVAFIVAMIFALLLAFFIEYWRNSFRTAHELEEEMGIPVLASIPRHKKV